MGSIPLQGMPPLSFVFVCPNLSPTSDPSLTTPLGGFKYPRAKPQFNKCICVSPVSTTRLSYQLRGNSAVSTLTIPYSVLLLLPLRRGSTRHLLQAPLKSRIFPTLAQMQARNPSAWGRSPLTSRVTHVCTYRPRILVIPALSSLLPYCIR